MGRLALTFDIEIGIGIGFWKEEVSERREEKGREGNLLYLLYPQGQSLYRQTGCGSVGGKKKKRKKTESTNNQRWRKDNM